MAKIHYKHPTLGYHSCGLGGENPEVTDDIALVTCGACLNSTTGKGKGGRFKREGGRNKVGIVLSDKAFENWNKLPKLSRSKTVSDFLEDL